MTFNCFTIFGISTENPNIVRNAAIKNTSSTETSRFNPFFSKNITRGLKINARRMDRISIIMISNIITEKYTRKTRDTSPSKNFVTFFNEISEIDIAD
jgi:hypothetical protein